MEVIDHIVEFDKYCKTCKYKKIKDEKGGEPCNDCLTYSVNTNSRKPVRYELDEEKVEDEKQSKE